MSTDWGKSVLKDSPCRTVMIDEKQEAFTYVRTRKEKKKTRQKKCKESQN
jgi:hypothetical protein